MHPQVLKHSRFLLIAARTFVIATTLFCCLIPLPTVNVINAHEIWIETSAAVVKAGEPFRCECKLGNSDELSSFKSSDLLPLKQLETVIYLPTEKQLGIRHFLHQTTTSDTTGSWRASLTLDQTGIAWFLQRTELKLELGKKIRAKLWAKTPVVVSDSLDEVFLDTRPVAFSQPFEIVLNSSPLPSLSSAEPIEVRLIKENSPLPNATVTFTSLPLGDAAKGERQQCQTDNAGLATYLPNTPGLHLVSCQYFDEQAKGSDYDATYYSATICLDVSRNDRQKPLVSNNEASPDPKPTRYVQLSSEKDLATWPAFLGGKIGSTVSNSLPITWSPVENIAWKTTLTGHGQSSPVVWNKQVFLTSVEGPNKETFIVTSLSLDTGEVLWKREVKNSYPVQNSVYVSRAAPTPVVDEQRVIAFFESGDCVSLDHTGKLIWQRDLNKDFGPFAAEFGLGASPCQDSNNVYVLMEHDQPGSLVALNKSTGESVWKADRPAGRSWSSPAYFEISGTPQIIVSSNGSVAGYDTINGQSLWTITGLGGNTGTTPIDIGNNEFLIGASAGRSGENEQAAKKSNGLVKVKKTDSQWQAELAWINPQLSPTWASPIVHDGLAYWVNRVGVVSCVDVKTGELVFAERTKQSCWATPIGWKDRIYFFGKDGLTTVIRSGRNFEVIAENEIVDPDSFPPETTTLNPESSAQRQQSAAMFSGPTLYAALTVHDLLLIRFGNQLMCVKDPSN